MEVKNTLTAKQMFELANWLNKHRSEVEYKEQRMIAIIASESVGFYVSVSNIKTCVGVLEADWLQKRKLGTAVKIRPLEARIEVLEQQMNALILRLGKGPNQ